MKGWRDQLQHESGGDSVVATKDEDVKARTI